MSEQWSIENIMATAQPMFREAVALLKAKDQNPLASVVQIT
mgnify:FL=1